MPLTDREYRKKLGFTNQNALKKYFKFTDQTIVNWDRIEQANERLKDMFIKLNTVVNEQIRQDYMAEFIEKFAATYETLKDSNIIPRLNNFGRTPDDVYYNWMRGRLVCEFFLKALSKIFLVPECAICCIGNDNLMDVSTFSQTATADLEITTVHGRLRLEVQSGFTGINDIKRHKVLEARKVLDQQGIPSYVVHFDLFNGKAALINISSIEDTSIHWEHRAQLEDQTVFSIPHDAFCWDLTEPPPYYTGILYQE